MARIAAMSLNSYVFFAISSDLDYCVKTTSKRTHSLVKTQSLEILSALLPYPHISFASHLLDLSSLPSSYRKDASVPTPCSHHPQSFEKLAFFRFIESLLPLFAALPPSDASFELAPVFLLRSHQLASAVLQSDDFPAVHDAAIHLLTLFPAVLLDFPSELLSARSTLESAMDTLHRGDPDEAATAAWSVAEMLGRLVAKNSEKPRTRREDAVVKGVSSTGVTVETALQWLLTRLRGGNRGNVELRGSAGDRGADNRGANASSFFDDRAGFLRGARLDVFNRGSLRLGARYLRFPVSTQIPPRRRPRKPRIFSFPGLPRFFRHPRCWRQRNSRCT